MAAVRLSLAERLDRAARHLGFVAEAVRHMGGKDVWFVVSTDARTFSSPPIGTGTCIAREGTNPARISAEGLGQIVDESRAAVMQARKALGGQPPRGSKTAGPRARR